MEEIREAERRATNARKAGEAADQLFPDEKWITVEEGIYLSPRRSVGKKSNYKDELRDAQILRNLGSTVYLVPEQRSDVAKKYDAIVNGMKFEFKNIEGNANTLETQFLRSRAQAPNVFINLEKSNLTKRDIMSTLYGAINKPETETSRGYTYYNRFEGGRIILKIRGQEDMLYLNIDDMKQPR
jgi:transcription initiation factor TFIID subunit TAF12